MRLDPVSPSAVWAVAVNMRERDRAEFEAVFGAVSATEIANQCAHRYGGRPDCFVIVDDRNEDVGVGGFIELRPRVMSLLLFATDGFKRVGFAATKRALALIEAMESEGAHRFECFTLAGYSEMQRWLRLLGFEQEGKHEQWGANGERFLSFARVRG